MLDQCHLCLDYYMREKKAIFYSHVDHQGLINYSPPVKSSLMSVFCKSSNKAVNAHSFTDRLWLL